jgi:acyl carrier protein
LRACEQAAAASSVACDPNATPDKFLRKAGRRAQKAILREDLRAALAVLVGSDSEMAMSTSSVAQVRPIDENVAVKVRALIAEYLGVDAKRVSNEALFRKDLGADWLDRLELVIAIEDRFGVEIGDDVAERIEAVGDLIHALEAQPLH